MKRRKNLTPINEAIELMNSGARSLFVDELHDSIERAIKRVKGEEKAIVKSALKLTEDEKKQLEYILTRIFSRKLEISYLTNPALLSGVSIRVGDWILDGTILLPIERI